MFALNTPSDTLMPEDGQSGGVGHVNGGQSAHLQPRAQTCSWCEHWRGDGRSTEMRLCVRGQHLIPDSVIAGAPDPTKRGARNRHQSQGKEEEKEASAQGG